MKGDRNLVLKIALAVLCVAIVGIGIGITVVVINSERVPGEKNVHFDMIQDAYEDCNLTQASYTVSGEKTYDEVVAEFEVKALEGSEDYYVDYLTCYAQFVFTYGSGFDAASEIMNRAEGMLDNLALTTRSNYYFTYSYLYRMIGDLEKEKHYNELGAQGFVEEETIEEY